MSTFSLGISGLSAAKKHLNTVGNNIANASTVGFKKSRAEFADVYATSGMGSTSNQTGNGVQVTNISQQFSQGGTSFTQRSLDMAIDGNGFFVVEAGNGEINYTRAGMFGVDKNGYVVTNTDYKLQGYPANANGDGIAVGAIDDIFIPQANISPNATSEIDVAFNLDSRADAPTNYIFDPNDSDTYTHLYPSVIYDTLGNSHTMTQYFVKQPPYLPEYGEPTRAIQTLIGAARHGGAGSVAPGSYSPLTDETDVFPGDADGTIGAPDDVGDGTLDADIAAILNGVSVDVLADPEFATAAPAGATVAERTDLADRLKAIKQALSDLVDTEDGRTKEFYEEAYKALDDYLPTVPTEVTGTVFTGALEELAGVIGDGQKAYAGIDTVTGDLRIAVMTTLVAPADPLTAEINSTNVPVPALASDYEDRYNEVVSALEAERDKYVGTEVAGVYQLALNVLQDIEKDWSDPNAAQESMIKVMAGLESEAADNRWHMHVTVDGETVTDDNVNTPDYFSFNFTEFGDLDEPLKTMAIKDWEPKDSLGIFTGADSPQVFEIDLTGTTQFAGSFGANSLAQDGYATGELAGLDIDDEGIIIASYTNSQTKLVGQVALANFRNQQGLTPVGGTMWAESTKSGDPVVNAPGVGIAGNITSKALEDSNVDLSEELVEMIIAQRDYQANAKTLQTADTLTQTIINLR
ncbi:flagellar hook-basal body complex protein [Oceanospirillum sp.]|uniref:flagellar hook-basal body complex protein n=1 Tax=Oceanospirillum sp. TaxID=2021254 RepID=UPI003A903910